MTMLADYTPDYERHGYRSQDAIYAHARGQLDRPVADVASSCAEWLRAGALPEDATLAERGVWVAVERREQMARQCEQVAAAYATMQA